MSNIEQGIMNIEGTGQIWPWGTANRVCRTCYSSGRVIAKKKKDKTSWFAIPRSTFDIKSAC